MIYIIFTKLLPNAKENDLNTQQLKCFVCVADKLNFTKAAEDLFLSVPTVTHHIKNLENELGTPLFIRTSKIVKLTDAGSHFYSDAKDILEKLDMAEKKIKKLAKQNTRFLRIGCTSNAELLYLEKILEKFRESFPDIYPQITLNDYFSLKTLFINNQLDIMLATNEMIKNIPSCVFKKIKSIKYYALVPKDSPLKNLNHISFEDLEGERIILPHPKFFPFQRSDRFQEKMIMHSRTHFDIICEADYNAILMSKCGYGISILPEFCIPKKTVGLPLIPIIIKDAYEYMEYGVIFHKDNNQEQIKMFIQLFEI